MAVTTQKSTELANRDAVPPVNNPPSDQDGKKRVVFFTHAQDGAGDATSSVAVAKLPPGKVRLLGPECHIYVNWTTATATLDAGWDAHTDPDGAAVAADPNGLDDGIDVDAAGSITLGSALVASGLTKEFDSKDGVTIRLTSQDTAIADGDDAVGYLTYVID